MSPRSPGPRRYALAAMATLAVALVPTGTAAAHSARQQTPDAAYYRSRLTAVVPSPPGVTVRVDPAGDIELTDTGSAQIVVLGYGREPYLRITATSVAENMLSQTTYINRSLLTAIPTRQDLGTVTPAWRQISATGTARWHDHRIQWMGPQRPPEVQADPSHPHLISTWEIQATADGQPFLIRGDLRWIGRPGGNSVLQRWGVWLIILLDVAICVPIVVGVRRRLRRRAVAMSTRR